MSIAVKNDTNDIDAIEGNDCTVNPSPYDDYFLFRRLL